jgi:glycosyltransferase involved in cell wall biosynthesis
MTLRTEHCTPGSTDLRPEDITIAVTVYSRREFVLGAIQSALDQTMPVKVMVVEDCGPDSTLQEFVLREFGSRIEYIRNPRNRGLFDNWNACLEYCRTPWLSILHDDDLLRPVFVEAMLSLAKAAPGRSLYFGRAGFMTGEVVMPAPALGDWPPSNWRDFDLAAMADQTPVFFPGHIMRVESVRALGGFHAASYFTGDWDMWFRLALRFGASQTATEVAVMRSHYGEDRGTSRVERKGWKWALDNVQRKRNLALLRREKGIAITFDRVKFLHDHPIPSRLLCQHAHEFSKRMLRYNAWLFTHSKAPHFQYAALQWLVRLLGPRVLRGISRAMQQATGKKRTM